MIFAAYMCHKTMGLNGDKTSIIFVGLLIV